MNKRTSNYVALNNSDHEKKSAAGLSPVNALIFLTLKKTTLNTYKQRTRFLKSLLPEKQRNFNLKNKRLNNLKNRGASTCKQEVKQSEKQRSFNLQNRDELQPEKQEDLCI